MLGITACATDDGETNQPPADDSDVSFREGSTVWYYDTNVYIIPAMEVDRDDLVELRDSLDDLAKNVYISTIYAEEQKCELVVGYVEDRAISVKAYRLLERMEKESYFDARYIIYAEGGSVCIAYDANEYSPLQSLEFAIDKFIEECVEGKEYVAFGLANRIEGRVDLIEAQEEIDAAALAEKWDKLFIEAGGETNPQQAKEVVAAFRKMHSLYDNNMVKWFANLYDPSVGGFYANNSGRNNEGFLPDIQSTVQALAWVSGSGMISFVNDEYELALPTWMKNQIIAFAKSLQSSKNGYFYHPQWTQEMVDQKISRRGRDLGWATDVLKELGSAPTYTAPNGVRGDGIDVYEFWESVDWYGYIGDKSEFADKGGATLTASLGSSVSSAVSKIVLTSNVVLTANDNTDYFATHENFYNYLQALQLEGHSYTIGNDFDATKTQIKNKSGELGAYMDDPSKPYYGQTLVEMWLAFYNEKVYPETGMWEADTDFDGTNGFMKTHTSYNYYGAALPYPLEAAKTVIAGLTSDQKPRHVCDNYNLWISINGIKENVTKYADAETRDEVLSYIDNALKGNSLEIINKAIERISMFKKDDGSFSYREFSDSATAQEMPVGLGVNEGGIDASGICSRGTFITMLRAFGFSEVEIFGEAEWMMFCETLEGLGPVIKFEADSSNSVIDFEDGSLRGCFLPVRNASADIVEYNGSYQLCVGIGTSTAAPGVDITKTLATNSGDYARVEFDVTFMHENDGYYQFIFNSTHKTSKVPMYFQFITKGDTISIKDMRFGTGKNFEIGKRGQQIHLLLEYFVNSLGQSVLRVHANGKYLGTITNTGSNASYVTGSPAPNLSRIEFAANPKNGGCVYIDNFYYGPDYYKDKDGDEVADAFPDNEGDVVLEESGTNPIKPDENGYIDFEDMMAKGNAYITQSVANTLRVTEKNGSDQIEFLYPDSEYATYYFYPTKAEDNAKQVILEADVTDCLANPRILKIYAGSTLVYDFRFNGVGGFTSENNQIGGWGNKHFQKDVPYRLKITIQVTDGKIDARVYVNGDEVARPSGYGNHYNLAASEDLVSRISYVSVAYNSSTKVAGSVYIDNYRFVKLAEAEVHEHNFESIKCPCGKLDPSHEHSYTDGKCVCGMLEPVHEHKFVDGKCECGEIHEHKFVSGKCECGVTDPGYNPDVPADHVHKYVDGTCECGAPDPDYKPGADDPVTPPTGGKTIKILLFGNSYSVDACKWMSKIFLEAGYDTVIIGNLASSGCCINEHWTFIDGIDGNEANGGSFFFRKYVNNKEVEVKDDYAFAIANEAWDIISIQHAPDELKQVDTYSHLGDLIDYILARVTNPDVKLVYNMIWAHNNVADIKALYNAILEITDAYVTVNSEFDGLIPVATMIEYMRDHGLTNAHKDESGNWVAGDITRDWGHLNYGLGRYALGLMFYAYLTGESIDDFTWVPTIDMVGSEADGFAEITPEKLAIIKAAIKYAMANPYGENYEPKNGDGVGFPDCEMGGNDFAKKPIHADENGVIDFENMTALGSSLVKTGSAGTIVVTEKNGSEMLECIYPDDAYATFMFYPTKTEEGATQIVFEADVIDCLANPRLLKIRAGSKVVYDFRFNGVGGITSENNGIGWGGGHYQKDVPYRLKITLQVTDGKIDARIYINGNEIARPSKYGTVYDLTADEDIISKISYISVEYNYSTKVAGSVFVDNLRFVKLATPEAPHVHEFVNGKCECGTLDPDHTHTFTEGKCVCGATDPNYKPECEHTYVDGKCTKCGEADPDYVPEGKPKPLTPDENGYISFEDMTAAGSTLAVARTEGMLKVTNKNGSDMLEFIYTEDKTQEFDLYPTKTEDGATVMIFEADVTDSLANPRTLTFYAGSKKVYDFRFNGIGGITSENNSISWGKGYYEKDVQYNLRIVIRVTDGKIDASVFINGNEIAKPSKYGTGYDLTAEADVIGKISRAYVAYGSGTKVAGSVFVDNLRFAKLVADDTPTTPPEGGDTHEHTFVEGKCECGADDPNYVAPECEHTYTDGECTKCGADDPDYVAPECEHTYSGGECTKCGEADPDYVAPEEKKPISADEDGVIDFENMTAEGSTLVKTGSAGTIVVTEKNGSSMLECIYPDDGYGTFYFYPTKTEDGATQIVFEADVIDSLGQPRILKIRAGSKVVYDFRFNGVGGITSENNGIGWGGGHYQKDVPYRLKITLQVTDGKIDARIYINGNEIARPSKYGTVYDLTADEDIISKISYISVEYNYSTKVAGSVFVDNLGFVKLAEAE